MFLQKAMKQGRNVYGISSGFLNLLNAPTDEAREAIPKDIETPDVARRNKTVFLFHDESTFNANDDQNMKWGIKGEKIMKRRAVELA